jgi:hypothetical protein
MHLFLIKMTDWSQTTEQRKNVNQTFSGPSRFGGCPGSGGPQPVLFPLIAFSVN